MSWDTTDFLAFGVLVAGAGVVYALVARKASNAAYRFALGVAVATGFILVWVNAAVGIIGEASDDANMLFAGVLVVGIIGALIARFRAGGMARALYATALAQVLVAAIALPAGLGSSAPAWPRDILILTGFFVVLWLVSAFLFRLAARKQRPEPG